MVHVKINNQPLQMELDTGAGMSVMPSKTQKRRFPGVKIYKPDIALRIYTGEGIKIIGKFYVDVV